MDADIGSHILSDVESRIIFEQEIIPTEFGNLSKSAARADISSRIAVIVVGQTGAGKTLIAPSIKQAMSALHGAEPAHIIADTYKTYHPAYARLILEKPSIASPACGRDARRWLTMAVEHAMKRDVPILLESACRHPADFTELVHMFQADGYRVEVAVMAVPEGLSRLGILARFYQRLPESASGTLPIRLTPRRIHDESYEGVLDVAKFIDSSDAVDQIVVVRRNNMVAYANERIRESGISYWKISPVTGTEQAASGVFDVVRNERTRPLTSSERQSTMSALHTLRALHLPVIDAELAQIEKLLTPILVEDKFSHFTHLIPLLLPRSDHDAESIEEVALRLGRCPP